ncbi:glycosyltransferase family 2 protein [Gangjinia marincola]|uniref:Glycosyltransferase family 2 protein n=1 Tax=Gangjinia marincola TaxID=578463 RepID=A0ABP3XUX7_9FLAO
MQDVSHIAVAILNWNGKALLEQFLPSVIAHSHTAVIYVIDNASTDESVAFLNENFPQVNQILLPENYGYAGGYNHAVRHIKEEILILLNSDVEVTKEWLFPLAAAFNAEESTAILQPKLLDYTRKNYFEYAGAAGGFIDQLGYPYCRGRIFDTLEKDTGQYDDSTSIFWASGACFCIRKSVFEQLGGFDEDFFAHQEEIDLCWRAHQHGFEVAYIPQSVVYHLGGASLSAMNPKKTFLNFRNTLLALLKNVNGNKVLLLLFLRLVLDGIAGMMFLLQGKPRHLLAILNAHLSFYRLLPKFLRKRKLLRAKTKASYYSISSVVVAYFIQKKRKYTQL